MSAGDSHGIADLLNKGVTDLDDELTELKRKTEEERKVNEVLIAEEKATLARIASLDNAIKQKRDEKIFLDNGANAMKKRLNAVNRLKDKVIESLQTQQNSVELLKSSLENDQQQLVKLEEAENNWKKQHRMDLSNIKSEHQLIQGDTNGMEIKFEDDKIYLMNEIEKFNKMVNDAQRTNLSLRKGLDKIQESLSAINNDMALGMSQLKEKERLIPEKENQKRELLSAIAEQNGKLEDLNAAKVNLEKRQIDHQLQFDKISKEHYTLSSQVCEIEEKKATIETAIQNSEMKMEEISKKCEDLRKLILEKTQGGIIETEQRLTAEISNARMKISMIDEELKSFPSGNSGDFANDENLIEELRQKISEFAVISKDDDATNFSLDALEKEILDLEEKFQLSSTKEANLDQEMEELVNEEKVLQREIPILEKDLAEKVETDALKKSEILKKLEMKKSLDEVLQKVQIINDKVKAKQFEWDNFDKEASKSLDELKERNQQEVVELEAKISDAKKTHEKLQMIKGNLKKQLEELEANKVNSPKPTKNPPAKKTKLGDKFPDRKPRRSLTSTTTTASTTTQEIQDTSSLTASAIRRRQRPFFASDSDDEDLFA